MCVRTFDFSIFRSLVDVVMADPPWDIHMDLPYGTMTDEEMRSLRVTCEARASASLNTAGVALPQSPSLLFRTLRRRWI